ncbi:glycosyltransferase [Desulfonatronum thioautotrophicum]|uniref:glycosyltransferase n=1 Tax=Desulfonatronum thioautotrophicum TaxID=617001 RepID=UPI000A0490CD|nr:glycosyltransferase [Desulfonatronum thioautotrophicum]
MSERDRVLCIPVGLVVIGRNEGERLRGCLESLQGQGGPLVYVDSGSTDGSRELARSLGAEVVELDMSRPFSMSRARNAGFARVRELRSDVEYVHFFDGDCSVVSGWVETALRFLRDHPRVAAVCGRRRERFPERSIYNVMADREWDAPIGRAASVGGDALYRVAALSGVNGFDETLIAGEEPELCFRLRRAGWEIHRIPGEMTLHDAQILRFGQWWKRMVRGGYGSLDVFLRCKAAAPSGEGVPFAAMVQSARTWTLGWAGGAAVLMLLFALFAGTAGAVIALAIALGAWAAQGVRIARKEQTGGVDSRQALRFGLLTMLGKWAQLVGHLRYYRDRRAGRQARLIEYKGPAQAGGAGEGGRSNRAVQPDTSAWAADRARYPHHAFFREQSLWALAVYRFGQWNDRRKRGPTRWLMDRLYWLLFRIVETLTGVSFTKETVIGPGLRIHHFGNIFIHSQVRMGAGCTLRQGVTIGNKVEHGPVPVIEDNVEFGAYAQVLGDIRIGQGAKIGAMSVVLQDVPPGHTAVGIPARIISPSTN